MAPRLPVLASAILLLVTVLSATAASPASAHDGDESQEGSLLVQQALGHLAHDPGPTGIDLAMEKMDDALAAEDQHGVVVDDVRAAEDALREGKVGQARHLLQGAIVDALAELEPATGEATGTTVVDRPLPGRYALTASDGWFLAASSVLLGAGLALSFRFRPRDTVRDMRRRLVGPRGPGNDDARPEGSEP